MGNINDTDSMIREKPKEIQLLHAAETGNLDLLLLQLPTKGVESTNGRLDIDTVNSSALTPLVLAAKEGHVECVEVLLEAGAKVDGVGEGNTALTPIWMATYAGHNGCVHHLIQAGANLNTKYPETPLYIAAREGRAGCLKLLIAAGADLEVRNSQLQTPLCVACRENHRDCIELLVSAGCDVNASDRLGHDALFFACQSSQQDPRIIELLLNKGSQVNQVYKKPYGFTPLHLTAIRGDLWTCKLLLLHGAYVFAKDNQGCTPIEVAQHYPLLQTWMELYRDYVPPLKQSCCWEIRKCLGSKTLWIQNLPIPRQLQDYLTDQTLWVLPSKEYNG